MARKPSRKNLLELFDLLGHLPEIVAGEWKRTIPPGRVSRSAKARWNSHKIAL
jgi:hypothetical protein